MKNRNHRIFNLICLFLMAFFGAGSVYTWQSSQTIDYTTQVADIPTFVYRNGDIILEEQNQFVSNEQLEITKEDDTTPVVTLEQFNQQESRSVDKHVDSQQLPKEINLDVPFTSQAPEKNWEEPWQDACEEAAVLMLDAYYNDYGLSVLSVKDEILKMVEWEEGQGWGGSIVIEKVKQFAEKFQISNFKFQIVEDPTVEDIKQYIANGNPVLVVASGKDLPNPHFKDGGPDYHALIIRGYTEDSFITNDPGTQFGKNFQYNYNDLMSAIHDWNDGDVKNGRSVILVIQSK